MFSIEEFAQANDIPLEEISESRFEWLLREAEAVIRSYRPALPEDTADWPNAAKVVAMRVVSRAFDAVDVPAGASSLNTSAGPFSMSTSFESGSTNGGVWLSKQDRILLRGRGGGAYSVNMMPADVGERSAYYRHCDVIWREL